MGFKPEVAEIARSMQRVRILCALPLLMRHQAPLQRPQPCRVKTCGCGLLLEKLNQIQNPYFHNCIAYQTGSETIDTSWIEPEARKLGYSSSQDGLAQEFIGVYDELMRAYAKAEIPEALTRVPVRMGRMNRSM
jgi:hypothetical protein